MTRRLGLFMVLCMFCMTTPAWADRNGISWGELNQEEQRVLQPFAGRWDQLPPERQGEGHLAVSFLQEVLGAKHLGGDEALADSASFRALPQDVGK